MFIRGLFYYQEILLCSVVFITVGTSLLTSGAGAVQVLCVAMVSADPENFNVTTWFPTFQQLRSRRNRDALEQNPGEEGLFTGTEGTAPPLHAEISEK